jgi:cystinosin
MNYLRKSTTGWSIINVMLDFAGGVFSIMQLLLDSWISGDWSGIMGFLIKMALGVVTLFFDTIFLLQHYVWFADSSHPAIVEVVDMEMKEVVEGEEDDIEKLKNREQAPISPLSESLIKMEENHNELLSEEVQRTI